MLIIAAPWLGPSSAAVAVLVVWLPMVGLGTVSHWVTIRLPQRWHRLRPWELDGRFYERMGVPVAKAVLRRGPLAAFNPRLHLPARRTPEELAALAGRMCEAEATHTILSALTTGWVVVAAARGWYTTAVISSVCNLAMNVYPAMLQRYNRVLLQRRFGAPTTG